jgi:hypothetical protein
MQFDDIKSSGSSQYTVFLDNYNRGNHFLNNVTGSFFDQIEVDKKRIIEKDNGVLKAKLQHIDTIKNDNTKSNYEKALLAGSLLADISSDILKVQDSEVKRSGVNIINSFLNIAKETEDQQLINIAVKITENIQL